MDRIPQGLAARFENAARPVRREHELAALGVDGGKVVLSFANGEVVRAARIVLALPVPAVRRLAAASRVLGGAAFDRVSGSVEAFPAMKLYLWYAEPWWRPVVPGIRTTTDLPLRKIFYFDGQAGSKSVLLGMYTDGIDTRPWASLYEGAAPGAPAPAGMLAEIQRQLGESHPEIGQIPEPLGSALMFWGADPHETGWHFWRAGESSDAILELAPQPDPTLPIYLANEAFSRHQSWVEGALEAAEAVIDRLR
jgi:monoamine oxidase